MKITWIIIALFICATIVLVVFYQPATQLVVRTFESVTGLQLVSSASWAEMQAENKILQQGEEDLQEQIYLLKDEREDMQAEIDLLRDNVSGLNEKVAQQEAELQEQLDVFEELTDVEHLQLFDNLTDAQHLTQLSDDGRALVTHERIKDANIKIHERTYYKQRSETLTELTGVQQQKIQRMYAINANLEQGVVLCLEQRAIKRQQYENCLEAHEDLQEQANRKALIGYVVGAAGLLIGFVL